MGITVAGTTYIPVTTMSFKRYGYVLGQAFAIDLSGVSDSRAMLARVFERGRGGELIAGFYVPVVDGTPEPWTPELAAQTATAINRLADADLAEIAGLVPRVLELLADFFPGVAGFSGSSATSSDPTNTIPASTSGAPTSAPPTATPSATSASSSAPSPATTSTATAASSAGMSAKA